MTIAAGNSTTQDTGTSPATVTIVMPTGADANSIVVVIIAGGQDSITGSLSRYTAPSGWTSIGFQNTNSNFNSGQHPMVTEAWWSLGNNTNLDFTANGGTGALAGLNPKYVGVVAINFTGVDLTTPIDATGTASETTASNTGTAGSVTTVTDLAKLLIGASDWNSAGGAHSATGFTGVDNAGANFATGLLYNNSDTTPAGATGTTSVTTSGGTASNQDIHLIPFALRPTISIQLGVVGMIGTGLLGVDGYIIHTNILTDFVAYDIFSSFIEV